MASPFLYLYLICSLCRVMAGVESIWNGMTIFRRRRALNGGNPLSNWNWPLICRRFIFIAVALIALVDLYFAAFGGAEGTISLQLFHMTFESFRKTTLVLSIGYILGHCLGRIDK